MDTGPVGETPLSAPQEVAAAAAAVEVADDADNTHIQFLAAAVVGLALLAIFDRRRFAKYVYRPLRGTASSIAAVLGFVGNFSKELSQPKHEEWKDSLDKAVRYLEDSGLDKQWGVELPKFVVAHVLLLNQIQSRFLERKLSKSETPLITLTHTIEGQHFMKFATAVYGKEMIVSAEVELGKVNHKPSDPLEVVIAKHCEVSPEDILVKELDYGDSTEFLQHLVVVDHKYKAVVLSVRGTFSLTSALVDLAAYTADFCGGRAHSGMADMARAVLKRAKENIISKLAQVPRKYELIVTGHSLGAGVACLINIYLHTQEGRKDFFGTETPPHRIRCMAFAPPPVFYPLEIAREAARDTLAFVHNMDCVPSASIHAVRRLVKTINAIEETRAKVSKTMTPPEFFKSITPKKSSPFVKCVQESIEEPLTALKGAEPLLVPSETLLWLHEEEEDSYTTSLLDVEYYSDRLLDVHTRMVSDHMTPKYENAFALLTNPEPAQTNDRSKKQK